MAAKRKITNGSVFTEQGLFTDETLYICDERIVSLAEYEKTSGEETVTDASGCYVIPGLTDIHFHGCMGSDCCDGTTEDFATIARYQLRQGVTSITPATMTMSEEVLSTISEAVRDFSCPDGADVVGLYMEGPFINMAKKARRTANTSTRQIPPCWNVSRSSPAISFSALS